MQHAITVFQIWNVYNTDALFWVEILMLDYLKDYIDVDWFWVPHSPDGHGKQGNKQTGSNKRPKGREERGWWAWRRKSTASDIISLITAAVPGKSEVNVAGATKVMSIMTFVALVENKVWKQGWAFASRRSTWSDGACRSPSFQLERHPGCCPSAGRSDSVLGGAALDWTLADTPGLSCLCQTIAKLEECDAFNEPGKNAKPLRCSVVNCSLPVEPVLVTPVMTIILCDSQTPQSH